MIRAFVTGDPAGLGVHLSIVNQHGTDAFPHEILRIVGDESGVHHFHWQPLVATVQLEPTLQIPGDMARAVFDGLSRHFGTAAGTERVEDAGALRKDYDAERQRVDKLIDALIDTAGALAEP